MEFIAADHERVLALFVRLLEATTPGARHHLVGVLIGEFERHAAAEAATLYAALREVAGAENLLADAAAEHDEVREAVQDLIATASDDPTWGEILAALRTCVEQHIETEEGEIFTVAEELLPAEQLRELGEAYGLLTRQSVAGSADLAGHPYITSSGLRIAVPYLRL
ncbi:MAG: hemerythrin domain-containing protein [bacterium]